MNRPDTVLIPTPDLPPIDTVHEALAELTWVVREANALLLEHPGALAPLVEHDVWEERRRRHVERKARLMARIERDGER